MKRSIQAFVSVLAFSVLLDASAQQGGKPKPVTPPSKPTTEQKDNSSKPKRVIVDFSSFELDKLGTHYANQASGASRGKAQVLTLCAPGLGLSETTRPLLEWKLPSDSAARLTLTVFNENGDVLVETDVTGSSFAYPSDAPPLEAGHTYGWKVAGSALDKLPNPAQVKVQGASAAVQRQAAAETDPLARAQVFLRNNLWYDAVVALRNGLRESPQREDLAEQLNAMYKHVAPGCGSTP